VSLLSPYVLAWTVETNSPWQRSAVIGTNQFDLDTFVESVLSVYSANIVQDRRDVFVRRRRACAENDPQAAGVDGSGFPAGS